MKFVYCKLFDPHTLKPFKRKTQIPKAVYESLKIGSRPPLMFIADGKKVKGFLFLIKNKNKLTYHIEIVSKK